MWHKRALKSIMKFNGYNLRNYVKHALTCHHTFFSLKHGMENVAALYIYFLSQSLLDTYLMGHYGCVYENSKGSQVDIHVTTEALPFSAAPCF